MALLNQAAQTNPLAGLLAQRRMQQQQQGGQVLPQGPGPQPTQPMQPMQPMSPPPMLQGPQAPTSGAVRPPAGGVPGGGAGGGGGQPSGGISGAMSGLLTGPGDPELSDEANRSALVEGLKAAGVVGLGALAAGAAPLALPVIGALAGRSVAEGERTKARQAQERALQAAAEAEIARARGEIGETLTKPEGLEIADVDRGIAMATALGDNDLMDSLIELRKSFPEPPQEEYHKPESVTLGDGTLAIFDPNVVNDSGGKGIFIGPDGERLMDLPEEIATRADNLQMFQGIDPNTGQPGVWALNLTQGTSTRIPGVVPERDLTAQKLDPNTIQSAADATAARNNVRIIKDFLLPRIEANPENPLKDVRLDRARFEQSGILGVHGSKREALPTETQQFLQAQESFMLMLANRIAGMRGITQEDARQIVFRTFGFEEGDSRENLLNTLHELEIGVQALEHMGAAALGMFENMSLEGLTPAGGAHPGAGAGSGGVSDEEVDEFLSQFGGGN